MAAQGYLVADRLFQQPDMEPSGFGQVAMGLAALARADAQTGRYRAGEPQSAIIAVVR